MKNLLLACLLLLITTDITTGQASRKQIGQKEQEGAHPSSGKAATDYSREPFIYEFIHASMRYEESGAGVREVTARARVNSAAGLNRLGQLIFDYNGANEHLEIRRVRVLKQDGSMVSVGADAVQDLTAPVAREAPVYTDARQKHVTVPALAVGDAVEYNVVTTVEPLLAGQFWETWNFNDDSICVEEQVELNVPAERVLKIKSPAEVKPSIREEAGRRIYRWTTSTTHYPDAGELLRNFKFDAATLLEGMRRRNGRQVIFSSLQSWEDVGNWYAGLERDRRTVTPEIRAQADEIVKEKDGDREKAQALYQWVARNIRYVSLSFGVGRYQPHAAADVLSHRYGDCKDKTTLLEAFFQAEGLKSQAVLINSRIEVEPDVPSPLQFDHAITHLELDGQEVWLDSTVGVGPFMYLMPQLRGKQSLVVFTDSAPVLKKTPEELAFPTTYQIRLTGRVNDDGKMDAVLSFDTRGDLEVLLRIALVTLPPGQITAIVEKAVADQKRGNDFSLHDLKSDDVTDTSKPLHVELQLTAKSVKNGLEKFSANDARDFIRGLAGGKETDFLLPNVAGKAKPTDDKKPVKLNGPREYSLEIMMTVPKAGTDKPESVHIARDFAEYESTTEWKESTFRGLWRLKVRAAQIAGKEVDEYTAFRKEVLARELAEEPSRSAKREKSGKGSVAARPAAVPPPHVRPPEAETLYQQGLAESKLQNWANAEMKFAAALKLDPEDKGSVNNLGRAQMYLRKYEKAESTFHRLMEIAPEDGLSTAQMAWVLTTEKKYNEAEQVLQKRVAAAPEDGDAHRRLGLVYVLTKRYDKAVPELEKATSLLPRNTELHFLLGRAYLRTNHPDQGAAEFEKALGIQTNDSDLNEAAYELATAGAKLDLAESWATRAIRETEVELNQVAAGNLEPRTVSYALRLAMYWDTLGWIKFQKNDAGAGEKYVAAAWQLTDNVTEGYHLGRIYEAERRKDEAIETYAQTLALAAIGRRTDVEPSDDEREARTRLSALLGGDSGVEGRIAESRARLKERRSVDIENPKSAEGMAEYLAVIGADRRILEVRPANPQNEIAEMTAPLRSVVMPVVFPDSEILRLPVGGVLACPRADQHCKFTIMPAASAVRTVTASTRPGGE